MFLKTLFIFVIVNLMANSYGQKLERKFRKDYTYLDDVESFYKIQTIPASWADAKRVCALEGATFWHPDNEKEFRAVLAHWKKTRPTLKWLWSGLSDILVEGRFETADGRPSSEVYINWLMNQPNNGNGDEDCTPINLEGQINDTQCNRKAVFICKKTLRSLEWNHQCDIPNLDYTYSKDTGKCYKLHTTPLTWTDANGRCQLEQSSLAVISNQPEADYLVKLIESTPKPRVKGKYQRGIYHLGYHNRLNEGWQTVKGRPLIVYGVEAWFENYQPDGEEECGAMFFNGRLVNTECDAKSLFICEHELNDAITPTSVNLANFQPYVGGGIE